MSPLFAPAWRTLIARCAPARPSPVEQALAEVYAVILAGGSPLFVAFIVTDAVRGFADASYWHEIPVNTLVFLTLATLALSPRLSLTVRGMGLALPLTVIAISDQLQAGASGLAPVVLVMNSAILALWNRRAASLGAGITTLALLGPALVSTASPSRSSGSESPATLALRLGTTLMAGVIVARGIRGLARDSAPASETASADQPTQR
jgi:hypothetical protein